MGPILFDLLDVFKMLKWQFPDDAGLVSFDDWAWSRFVGDGIFLVQQDMETMGQLAAKSYSNKLRLGLINLGQVLSQLRWCRHRQFD